MSLHQVTRHIAVEPDQSQSDKVLLSNLLSRSRLLAGDDVWELLDNFRQPRLLLNEPLQARAAKAGILAPTEEQAPQPQLTERFREVSAKVLQYRKTEPADDLFQRVEQLKAVCKPLSNLQPSDYFIWQNPGRVFEILLDHFKTFMELETGEGASCDLPSELVRRSVKRPPCIQTLEQQTCTLDTTWKRAQRMAQRFPEGGKALILGDDDLVSLALCLFPQFEIDVLELDLKLVHFLKKEGAGRFRIKRRDLSGGLPSDYQKKFDVVVSDPMYSAEGMAMFVHCCAQALSPTTKSRLFLSTHPPLLEAPDQFFRLLEQEGLQIVNQEENFSRYPFPEDSRVASKEGLVALGYHPKLVKVLTDIPYLYANLYECALHV